MRKKSRKEVSTRARSIPVEVREDDQHRPVEIREWDQWLKVDRVVVQRHIEGPMFGTRGKIKSFYRVIVEGGNELIVSRTHVYGDWYREEGRLLELWA